MRPENLAKKVITEVERRDLLDDMYYDYRRGIKSIINTAMDQYVDTMHENSNDIPVRLKAISWALNKFVDKRSRHSYSFDSRSPGKNLSEDELYSDGLDPTSLQVSTFHENHWKCNKMVSDAYAVGAEVGLCIGKNWSSAKIKGMGYPASYDFLNKKHLWPPRANYLADRDVNIRSLTHAQILRKVDVETAQPDIGDIICFPAFGGGTGHASLYLGKGLVISAKSEGIEIGLEEYEKDTHDRYARIRKFTGSGK